MGWGWGEWVCSRTAPTSSPSPSGDSMMQWARRHFIHNPRRIAARDAGIGTLLVPALPRLLGKLKELQRPPRPTTVPEKSPLQFIITWREGSLLQTTNSALKLQSHGKPGVKVPYHLLLSSLITIKQCSQWRFFNIGSPHHENEP